MNKMRTNGEPGFGKHVVAQIRIRVWDNGALSIDGPVGDPVWMLACLANAADAVRNQQLRRESILVEKRDVSIPGTHS